MRRVVKSFVQQHFGKEEDGYFGSINWVEIQTDSFILLTVLKS